jgi:hypothetical protein
VSSSANTAGESVPGEFYDSTPLEPEQLYQGEILANVPILSMPKPSRWLLLRTKSGRRVDEALNYGIRGGTVNVLDANHSAEAWYSDGLGDFVMAVLDKRPALVLSQTCDLQTKDFFQVAPIFPALGTADDLTRLRAGDLYSAVWLDVHAPELPTESYADLELIQAVHKTYVRRIRQDQHFRLSPERTRLLQQSVTRFFGRPNSYDSRSDTAPSSGTYLCVACFYFHGRSTPVSVDFGSQFPACSTCGGTQWVIQNR